MYRTPDPVSVLQARVNNLSAELAERNALIASFSRSLANVNRPPPRAAEPPAPLPYRPYFPCAAMLCGGGLLCILFGLSSAAVVSFALAVMLAGCGSARTIR